MHADVHPGHAAGNAEGLGCVRRDELVRACEVLGVRVPLDHAWIVPWHLHQLPGDRPQKLYAMVQVHKNNIKNTDLTGLQVSLCM
jgi:hypothetical protein